MSTDTDTQGEGCEKTEAEIGVTLPQAEEHLEPPEAGRGRKDAPARSAGKSMALQTP